MLDASRTAIAILDGRSLDELATQQRDRLAIERLLEIIGEAANHVGHPRWQASTGFPGAT
jgi:uncharacterized protein with HEPN domain